MVAGSTAPGATRDGRHFTTPARLLGRNAAQGGAQFRADPTERHSEWGWNSCHPVTTRGNQDGLFAVASGRVNRALERVGTPRASLRTLWRRGLAISKSLADCELVLVDYGERIERRLEMLSLSQRLKAECGQSLGTGLVYGPEPDAVRACRSHVRARSVDYADALKDDRYCTC
jgi:hypothetical protein